MKQTSEKRKRLEKLIRTRAASSGGRFREVITLPQHTSREDWIEAHLVFFYNETEAVYELCQTDAKRFSKPGEGFPPRFEYKISQKGGKPERCSASQYVAYVFSWIAGFVGKSGGVKAKSPGDIVKFDALTNKAFTRLFRVLAIIYHSHFKVVEENDGAGLLNVTFKHFYYFCLEHMEINRNEFKALATLCQRLDSMYIAESMQPRGNTRRGDLSGIVQATDMFSPGRKSTRKDLRAALHQQSRADLMRAPTPDNNNNNNNNSAGRQRSIFFDSAATLSRASSVYAQLVKVHEGSSPEGQACVDAARGLFETESSFGEMLWSLHDDFMLPAQDLDFDTKYIHEMFVNINNILRLSELLVVEMHLALIDRLDSASNLTIPNVVSAVAESIKPHLWFFTLYSRFLATYDRTVAAIKSEKARNKKFLALLDEQEDFVLKSLKKVAERPAELRKMLAVLTDTFVAFSKSDAQGRGGIVVAHDFVDSASQQWGAQTSQPKKVPQVIEEVKAVEREMHRQLAIIEGRHISLKSQIAIQDSEAPGDTFLCAGSCETQHIVMGDDAPWNTSHIFLFKSVIVIALETTAPKPTLLERLSVRVKSMPRFVEVKDNRTEDMTSQITVVSGPKTLKKSQMAVKHAFPISACSISSEQRRKAEFVANAHKYKICFSVQLENEDFSQDVNVLTESADVATSFFQVFNQTVPIRLFQAESKASEAMVASRRNSASRLSALRSSKPRDRTPKPVQDIPVPEGILGQGTNLDFIVVTHYSSPSDQGASLCADLTTQGFKVSLDCRGDDVVDLSGESATVRRAKALIFFMSPGALLRPWVQADINEARHRKKPIIVIFPRQSGQSTKQFIAQERRLAPKQLHFVFSESGLVPLEIQGVPREAMWEEVLAKLRMARPRPKSGRSVN